MVFLVFLATFPKLVQLNLPFLIVKSNSNTNATLNINGLGQKEIRDVYLNKFASLKANVPYFVIYNGTYWIVQCPIVDANVALSTANNAMTKANNNATAINNLSKVYSGSGDPSNSVGKNGDIYVKY